MLPGLLNIKHLFVLEAQLLLSLQLSLCTPLCMPVRDCLPARRRAHLDKCFKTSYNMQVYRPMCLLKPCVNIFLTSCQTDAWRQEVLLKLGTRPKTEKPNERRHFFGTDLHMLNSYFSAVTGALAPQSEKQLCSDRTSFSENKQPKSCRVLMMFRNYSCY